MSLKNERLGELTADLVLTGDGLPKFEERPLPAMTERQAMLYGIRQTEGDTPKLIYADFLEEREEYERARLIRVMVDVADRVWENGPDLKGLGVPEWHAEIERRKRLKHSLKAEQKALQESLIKSWFPAIAVKGVTAIVRKGIVVGIDMSYRAWEMQGDLIYETELPPIVTLTLPIAPTHWRVRVVRVKEVAEAQAAKYPLTRFDIRCGMPDEWREIDETVNVVMNQRMAQRIEYLMVNGDLNGGLPQGVIAQSDPQE